MGEASAEGKVKIDSRVKPEPPDLQEPALGLEGVALGREQGDDPVEAAGVAVLGQLPGGLGLFNSAGERRFAPGEEALECQGGFPLSLIHI